VDKISENSYLLLQIAIINQFHPSDRFNSGGRAPDAHWIGSWHNSRAS